MIRMSLSKTEIVQQYVVKLIFTNDLVCGDSLMGENYLAKELDVSRTSVRAALQNLSSKGVITIIPKSGSVVNSPEEWNWLDNAVLNWVAEFQVNDEIIGHLMATRLVFEPNIASLAAINATGKDLALIEEAYDLMVKGVELKDQEMMTKGDVRFHHSLLLATHNPFLIAMGDALTTAMTVSFKQTCDNDLTLSKPALDEHFRVMDAVRMREPESARNEMKMIVVNAINKATNVANKYIKYIN
ncbi:GntR family transcriptional regulator [Aliivibrio fischeri]|nr:GntR family transcriptional regulator [Aliivibrio fischeri]